MASEIQQLKKKFQGFKKEVIGILEELCDYLYERDVLGTERKKAERIKELIKSLKESK